MACLRGCEADRFTDVEMFEYVGETLRRLRKEGGKTLEQIGKEAHLGRGQLSRIENGHQEATLSTLAKILDSQRITRREFFRRYELVEKERTEARGPEAAGSGSPGAPGSAGSLGSGVSGDEGIYQRDAANAWPHEVREVLSRVESFIATTFTPHRPVAQGAIELGDFLILFRVVPKSGTGAAEPPATAAPEPPPPPPSASRASTRGTRGRRGRSKR
jgi:transcriptional regulator with XRE-family HTH domain